MNRRELVQTGIVTASAVVASTLGAGATQAMAATGKWAKVAETAAKCLTVGETCAAHCEEQLGKGNKEMAACHAAVTDMLAACASLHKLAARSSKHTAAFAKACAVVCADCAKVCEPHAKHMAECKACMESCKECEKACNEAA